MAFEVTVSNNTRNQTQNIPGKYGSFSGEDFTAAACQSGRIVVKKGLIPCVGYESITTPILNGNTWYFVDATNGASGGAYGDHTNIYVCNPYDVNKVISGDLAYNLGAKTLDLTVPADERTDFTEIVIGEQYTWDASCFTTLPSATNKYVTIAAGKLVGSATVPAGGSGVYFELLRTKPLNEGASFFGTGYVLVAKRTAEATA